MITSQHFYPLEESIYTINNPPIGQASGVARLFIAKKINNLTAHQYGVK